MSAVAYVANLINKFDLSSEKSRDDSVYEKGKEDFLKIKREISFIIGGFRPDILKELDENGKKVLDRFRSSLEPIIYESIKKKG